MGQYRGGLNLKNLELRNAYSVNLEREYNLGKSFRHLNVKMYADLIGNYKMLEIKNFNDNNKIINQLSSDTSMEFLTADLLVQLSA